MVGRPEVLARLSAELDRWAAPPTAPRDLFSTGIEKLDRLFPKGGLRRGSIVEWLGSPGGGATSLAIALASRACSSDRPLVLIDRAGEFYPPALEGPISALVVVRPREDADAIWAMEQVLRCPAVGAALCWPSRLSDRESRRLQLAAEKGGAVGFFLRPLAAEKTPCWAESRFRVDPLPAGERRRWRVLLLQARGGRFRGAVELELGDGQTGDLRLAEKLAPPMAAMSLARA